MGHEEPRLPKIEIFIAISEGPMKRSGQSSIDLSVNVAGIEFPNPLLLASGICDETGASMAEVVRNGAGGVVTKSLSLEPRNGHPNPSVVELPYGIINAMGLPNPGIETYRDEISSYLELTGGSHPIIASVFGSSIDEYAEAASLVSGTGVSAIEINGSCPNAKGLGLQFGQDPDVIRELVRAVKGSVNIPVMFKLTPNTTDITVLARAAQEGGADGVVAINTLQAMKIDIHARRPILTNVTGGLSGPAIMPVGVRCVHAIASDPEMKIPVIGVGGISSYEDVLEYMMAGASLVQVGTAVTWEDLGVFSKMETGLRRFLEEKNVSDIRELIGAALEERG